MQENLKLYTQISIRFTIVTLNHTIILPIYFIQQLECRNNISYFLRKLFTLVLIGIFYNDTHVLSMTNYDLFEDCIT